MITKKARYSMAAPKKKKSGKKKSSKKISLNRIASMTKEQMAFVLRMIVKTSP